MPRPCPLADSLPAEHRALCRAYAAVQERCSQLIAQQRAEIAQLQAQVLRLRAAAIVQVSELALAREDPAALQGGIPGVSRRVVSAPAAPLAAAHAAPLPGKLALLEASMAAADLVICQTGCLSHGAYWRDHEHCRRIGKACTLPDAPTTTHLMVKKGSSPGQAIVESYQKP